MLSVTRSRFFVTVLLGILFTFPTITIAQAIDTPELTWQRGRQQSITLGGNTADKLWQINLEANGKSLRFDQSSVSKNGFIVYTVEIPENLAVGRYEVVVSGPATTTNTVAFVNISPTVSYDPLADPKKVGVIAVIAFTLLTFFTGNRSEDQSGEEAEESEDQSALGSVDTAYMGVGATKRGRGDLIGIGRSKIVQRLDLIRHLSIFNTASRSPLVMRIVADSSYLQAISGFFVLLLPVIGVGLGVAIALDTEISTSLIPTSLGLTLAIVVLALLDALSGLIAFIVYFLFVILSGEISNFADVQALLGMSLLWFTPALAAGATRPLRRALDDWDLWERVTDILVSTLLTGWAIKGMVLAIDGFAKEKTSIATHSDLIALVGAAMVIIRYLLEEFATRYTPARLEYLSPPKVKSQDLDSFLISLLVKALIFIFFMFGFFGFSWQILAATAALTLPSLLKRFDKALPNIPALFQIIPGGVPSIVVMSFIGTAFSNWANSLPLLAADKSKTLVVICSLPGFVISLLKLFGRSPKPGDVRFYRRDSMKIIYRTFGPIMLFIASLITIGVI
jgi:hypothetical protein